MLLELILALLIGVSAGTITGLIPGIHTNLIAVILLSIPAFTILNPITAVIFIASMAITHTFLDFIPAIYLGAPDEDTALSIMPGHTFLLQGKAHQAVLLTLVGSTIALILTIIITPIFILIIPKIYPFIQKMMSWFLIWISIFLISREKQSKLWALIIFILAGFLGIASLNLQATPLLHLPPTNNLLPLLTGLFGSSTLIYSISQKIKIPKQKIGHLILTKKEIIKPTILTTLVSPFASFFPGLGSSQAAIIGSNIIEITRKQFLILLGSVNTLVMSISFVTLYLIQKPRTGAASAIAQLTTLTLQQLIYILIAITITSIIAIFLTIKISKIFATHINKLNYSKISVFIIILLAIITIIFSGFTGFLIFLTATCLGLTAIYSGVRRSHLMGSLLIPTILLYLPFI